MSGAARARRMKEDMSLDYESQVVASCDICHDSEVSSIYTLAGFKKILRRKGWTKSGL